MTATYLKGSDTYNKHDGSDDQLLLLMKGKRATTVCTYEDGGSDDQQSYPPAVANATSGHQLKILHSATSASKEKSSGVMVKVRKNHDNNFAKKVKVHNDSGKCVYKNNNKE